MHYECDWAKGEATDDLRLISLVDSVMGDEIREAAALLASNPTAHAVRARRPFSHGMEYRFLVRGRILVRLRFTFDPPRNRIVIRQLLLTQTSG